MRELFEQYNTVISAGAVVVLLAIGYIRVAVRAKKVKADQEKQQEEEL